MNGQSDAYLKIGAIPQRLALGQIGIDTYVHA